MQAAENNLQQRLEELTAQLCRVRQEMLTAALLDVVSGFASVVPDGEQGW